MCVGYQPGRASRLIQVQRGIVDLSHLEKVGKGEETSVPFEGSCNHVNLPNAHVAEYRLNQIARQRKCTKFNSSDQGLPKGHRMIPGSLVCGTILHILDVALNQNFP